LPSAWQTFAVDQWYILGTWQFPSHVPSDNTIHPAISSQSIRMTNQPTNHQLKFGWLVFNDTFSTKGYIVP